MTEDTGRRAAEALAAGDPTGWFEPLYQAAELGAAEVPWDRGGPHLCVTGWPGWTELSGAGRRAVVVGCGLGDDAEFVARHGFATVAFDVAASAVRGARRRFPETRVDYCQADLFALPEEWTGAFDLVVESQTVQSLPRDRRAAAIAAVRCLVAPGGALLGLRRGPGPRRRPGGGAAVAADACGHRRLHPIRLTAARRGGAQRGPGRRGPGRRGAAQRGPGR